MFLYIELSQLHQYNVTVYMKLKIFIYNTFLEGLKYACAAFETKGRVFFFFICDELINSVRDKHYPDLLLRRTF